MPALNELFTPAAIATNWTEVASNEIPYFGLGLFPPRKKAGLDLKWFKGSRGLPVSLMPSAFDVKSTFRNRIGVSKIETEMPFFREGIKLKERDRQDILRIQDTNDPYAIDVLTRVYDDVNELIRAADVVPERMRMQLLFPVDGNAGIAIQANGVDYSYKYDKDGIWKSKNYFTLSGDALWSAASTANPFADFKKVKDAVRSETGAELTTAIMNTATFNLLGAIDAVKNRFLTANGQSIGFLTDGDVKNVFSSTSGIQIAVYDKMYKDESGAAHKFAPDGYVSLIPSGALGSTWYGTTPEEADLLSGQNVAVSIVNTGVAITQFIEPNPVNVNTIASEIVLPSFERMDEVALLKVA